jgi:hypothetical protein
LLPQTAAAEEKSVRSRNGGKTHFQVLAHKTTQENTHTKRERERERERGWGDIERSYPAL